MDDLYGGTSIVGNLHMIPKSWLVQNLLLKDPSALQALRGTGPHLFPPPVEDHAQAHLRIDLTGESLQKKWRK